MGIDLYVCKMCNEPYTHYGGYNIMIFDNDKLILDDWVCSNCIIQNIQDKMIEKIKSNDDCDHIFKLIDYIDIVEIKNKRIYIKKKE